jgi:hypothetical protein
MPCGASVSALQIVVVTVHLKVLQNERLVRFSKRTDCWCAFSWSISSQNGHFIKCIQSSSCQGYDVTHNHGKTSSSKGNSSQNPKLSERDYHTLKRIMSKNPRTTVAKVTAEFSIHPVDPVSMKKVSFKNPPSTVELQLLNL